MRADSDTDLGGQATAFPVTRCSLLRATAAADAELRRQAFDSLVAAYWKPVYKYVRVRWKLSNEDAKDRTQAFFTLALEKTFFERYDPARASFRTFLRVCVDRFLSTQARADACLKRRPEHLLTLDFEAAENELCRQPATNADPEELFRREWLRDLFSAAVDELRRHCAAAGKDTHFALFERYDLAAPEARQAVTYAVLAAQFRLPVTQVTNYLALVRRQFRRLVLERLRTTTGGEDEFEAEAQRLFGGRSP
jgi:RNA polymerase sigma factor (sigma-70 family)